MKSHPFCCVGVIEGVQRCMLDGSDETGERAKKARQGAPLFSNLDMWMSNARQELQCKFHGKE